MSPLCLIVLPWLVLRLLSGFRLGLLCDLVLVGAFLHWYSSDSAAPTMHPQVLLVPLYGAAGLLAYRLACLGLGTPWRDRQAPGESQMPAKGLARMTQLRLCLLGPIHEELTWRVAAQSLLAALLGPWPACFVTAGFFTAWHRSVWRSPALATELFLFALLLGCSLAATSDPLLPVCLHVVRNTLVLQQSAGHALT